MRKIKLLIAAAALMLGAGQTWAQTDVTSTYLTNAGFDNCTAETSDVAAKTIKDYSTNGWTNTESGEFTTIAVTSYGSNVKVGGSTTPSTKKDGTTVSGNTLGIIAGWGDEVIIQSDEITLPAGVYTLTVDHYLTSTTSNYNNTSSKFGFVTSTNSYLVSSTPFTASTWTTETVTFTLTESTQGKIQIGLKGLNKSGSGSPAVFYDDVTITWTDPLQAAKDALQAEIDKATLCPASEGLAGAIATAQGVLDSATTEAELTEALAALQAADKDAVLRYENGLSDATALAPVVTNFVVNGKFDDSDMSMWTCTGGFQNTGRKTTDDSNAGNMNGSKPWWENWHPSAKVNKMYQTIENIPNGTYRLDITAFVNNLDAASQYVFANSDQTPLTDAALTGATYEVYTVVTNNQVEVGLEQTTAKANWMGIDNVSLRYYGAGDVINDAQNAGHKLAWEEALANAEAAIADAAYSNVTGKEKSDLETEIGKAEPTTAEGYDDATAALTSATTTFINAKAIYDLVAVAGTLVYADASKKPVITDETTAASLVTPLRAYYESHALAEGVTGAVNQTESITNANNPTNNDGWTWTGNKNNPASNEPWTDADGTNTHSYFDGGNWGANSWTTTMSQTINIPAGKYLLTAKARAAENVTFTMAVGEESVELPHVGNQGNVFDRGWGDASLVFDSKGKGDEILVTATSNTIHEWFSISDFRLVQIEDHTQAVANEDLAAAIQAANDAQNEVSELLTIIGSYADPSHGDVLYSEVVRCSEATALTGAITNAQNVDVNDIEAVIAATEALETATATYLAAVPAYERAEMAVAFASFEKLGLTSAQQSQLVLSLGMKLMNPNTTAADLVDPANTAIQGLVPYFVNAATVRVGFESGEYAPYNNVEGLQALVASEAIGTNPADYTNEQISEQCLILVNYEWTKNTEDVDAIFNGDMAIANGNDPMGWTRSNGAWGQQITGLTMETNGTESSTAWYYNTNGAWQYGNNGVYTMPLAANTAYKLTFKYAKHGNDTNNWMKASVLNSENEGLAVVQYPGASDATLYQSASAYFTTGEEGNYILSLEQNGNVHLTDVSLVKAEPMPLSEGSNYTPELAYYETLTLTRNIKASYNTVCLPFDLSAEQVEAVFGEGSVVYEYEDVPDGTNSTINFNSKSENTIAANVPVLVKATAAATEKTINGVLTSAAGIQNVEGTNFDFVGTYNASMTIAAGDYFIGNGAIYRSKGETTIAGFRAYIKAKELGGGARIAKFFINGNEATAIEGLEVVGADNGKIYNLNGQEVKATKKGLYIQNGKKVVK